MTFSLLTYDLSQDQEIAQLITKEQNRQSSSICLIASENIASRAVAQAQASCFMNKYAEGTVNKRFYQGCEVVDEMEALCQSRLCSLFDVKFANVQPHSGAQANMAVLNALLNGGDTILGMNLQSGGHLSHGFKLNFSGKYYNAVQYNVDPDTCLINYAQLHDLARKHGPKLIIAGASSYSRHIEWNKLNLIAKEIGAYLLADIAHIAGLIAGKALPNPMRYVDIITGTTHKTLRGPRGGFIATNSETLIKQINSSVMPGIQGGPLMHTIAAKAVCFRECATSEFMQYARQVIINAKAMVEVFRKYQVPIVANGTDNHMFIIDVRCFDLTGKAAANLLAQHGLVCNYNAIPFDPLPLMETCGIRIGTPSITSCGFDETDCRKLAIAIVCILRRKMTQIERDFYLHDLFAKVDLTYRQIYKEN